MALVETQIDLAPERATEVEELLAAAEEPGWMLLEDKPTGRVWIAGYFPDEAAGRAAAEALSAMIPEVVPAGLSWRVMPDEDWRDSYKAHFTAWSCGRLHWVPVWERQAYGLPEGAVAVWLDPGLAFGTGNHETTRLCCERLVSWAAAARPGARIVDAGCGSGILAISAAKLGFDAVRGFDNDPEAVRVSRENAELNGVVARVVFAEGDLCTGFGGQLADLVLANIQADVLMRFASELTGAVAPGGALVMSGILAAELEGVRGHFAAACPTWPQETRTLGEWSDLVLRRPQG